MSIKRLFCQLTLISFLWLPIASYASPDLFLLNLYRIERCTLMASSEHVPADYIETCEELLFETATQAESLEAALPEAEFTEVATAWESLQLTFEDAIQDPEIMTDYYIREEIQSLQALISSQITPHLQYAEGPMALAQQLEIIAREYLQRSTSAFGMAFSSDTTVDIALLVTEADERFEALLQKHADDPDLRSAHRRYMFVRSRLIDYNNNMVSFLVDTYTNDMVSSLLAMSEDLSSQRTAISPSSSQNYSPSKA